MINPLCQRAEHVFAARGVGVAFDRRRCRPENRHAFFEFCPNDCDVASVISWRLLLFVGSLVLFVDHNQSEIFERRENRAPRANHDPRGCRGGNIVYTDGHAAWMSVKNTVHRSPQNGTNDQSMMPTGPDGKTTIPVIVYDPTSNRLQYNTQPNGSRVSAAVMKVYASGVPEGSVN